VFPEFDSTELVTDRRGGRIEKQTEKGLVKAVKGLGGLCLKMVGFAGMPDRIVLLPGGRVGFIEVKQHGLKPRPLQVYRHEALRKLGFMVIVLDDPERIVETLEGL
jgi:hypothetical protein